MLLLSPIIASCGASVPIPYPDILAAADKSKLEEPSCFRFKGKLYVLGGYHEKKVPGAYVFGGVPFQENKGMQYDSVKIPNRKIFEITDEEEAFVIENHLLRSKHCDLIVNPVSWKSLGSVSSMDAVRDSKYYLEFKGNMYVIGGTGHKIESDHEADGTSHDDWKETQYADVWMSTDVTNWKRVCSRPPWSREKNCRRHHNFLTSEDGMYLNGGIGMPLNGTDEDELVGYDDVWSSTDGKNWQRDTKKHTIEPDIETAKIDGRYFHIRQVEDKSRIYVSDDGENWQLLMETISILGVLKGKLAMIIPNDQKGVNRHDLYLSTDGLSWRHGKSGKTISFVPRSGDEGYDNYSGFQLVEFKDAMWLIGQSPDRIYRTGDGTKWEKVEVAKGKGFLSRSGAAIGVYGGYIWIMGGIWSDSVALKDVWRSSDGRNWELVTDNAPWGSARYGDVVVAKGRLFLVKRGVRWDRSNGVVGAPVVVWSTTDGTKWEKETGNGQQVFLKAFGHDNIEIVVDTGNSLYFFDRPQYELFLRDISNRNSISATYTLKNSHFSRVAEIDVKGEPRLFITQTARDFWISRDLIKWEDCFLRKASDRDEERVYSGFLFNYDDEIRYRPFVFKGRLFMAGVDFGLQSSDKAVYATEMVLDPARGTIRKMTAGTGSGNKSRTSRAEVAAKPRTAKEEKIAPGTFRLKAVEYMSWDSYDGEEKRFLLGHHDNKPKSGMSFKIRLPDGNMVEKITDKNGVIELEGIKPGGVCEISHELEISSNYHAIFYERLEPVMPTKINPYGQRFEWRKTGLVTGRTHLFGVQ